MTDLKRYSDFLANRRAELALLDERRATCSRELADAGQDAATWEAARDVVSAVLVATQQEVFGFVERICSLALSSIYGEDYGFALEHEVKRNQAEARPRIVVDGQRYDPDEVGGGVVDVVSLALRLAVWSMTTPRPRPLFVLDEPARFLSRDLQDKFGALLARLAEMLGVQILIVSHSRAIIDCAERAYEVRQASGISEAERLR